jgi:hypothetical protein
MGHTRLGTLPKTRQWNTVAEVYANAGSDLDGSNPATSDFKYEVARIADAAMVAATAAFENAKRDALLGEALFLLTQVALAARRENREAALAQLGVHLPGSPTPISLVTELNRVLDEARLSSGTFSDVGEMAQAAMSETLSEWFRKGTADLFATKTEQFWQSMYALGTQKAFGTLTRDFMGNLIARILGFHLSRIVAPGDGQSLLRGVSDASRFRAELRQHAQERAFIVRDFAAGWFSKREFEHGIDRASTRRFGAHALKKVVDELRKDSVNG